MVKDFYVEAGGEGGIRTPDTLASMPHFECGAFNRSATSPQPQKGLKKPSLDGRYVTKGAKTDKGERHIISPARQPRARTGATMPKT
jgi:hypothetical protein